MDLHFDKTTGKANEVVEKDLASDYRESIEKITNYLSLELSSTIELVQKKSLVMYLMRHMSL